MLNPRALSVLLTALLLASTVSAHPLDKCQEYIKYGTPGERGDLLCRKGFALAHNPNRKTPDWVAEHLTAEKARGNVVRSNDFAPDPDLPRGARAELADYKNSGYDRGHMAPAADMQWDEQAMRESFYLSNMTPQVGSNMNRGIWMHLEKKVRGWAETRREIYIFTGPIYSDMEAIKTIGSNQVAVPTHFYKIIFDPIRVEAIAFIMPNEALRTEDMPKYLATVDEVEAKTELNFLSGLNPAIQELVESQKADGLWE